MGIGFFNEDERILINAICKGEKLDKLTKKDAEEYLFFARQITNEEDEMTIDLVETTYQKVQNMTEEEWNQIKMLTPLPVSISQVEFDAETVA